MKRQFYALTTMGLILVLSGCSNTEKIQTQKIEQKVIEQEIAIKKDLVATSSEITKSNVKSFSSDKIGISFNYPSEYILKEDTEAHATFIALAFLYVGKEDFQGDVESIQIASYLNNENETPLSWAKNNRESNFANEQYKAIEIGNKKGISYVYGAFGGIATGESIIFQNNIGNIVHIQITRAKKNEKIKNDFENLIKSIQIK